MSKWQTGFCAVRQREQINRFVDFWITLCQANGIMAWEGGGGETARVQPKQQQLLLTNLYQFMVLAKHVTALG